MGPFRRTASKVDIDKLDKFDKFSFAADLDVWYSASCRDGAKVEQENAQAGGLSSSPTGE